MDIVIDLTQYDEAEIEEGVADLLDLVAEAVEEGHDVGQLIVIIGIALRMLIEKHGATLLEDADGNKILIAEDGSPMLDEEGKP